MHEFIQCWWRCPPSTIFTCLDTPIWKNPFIPELLQFLSQDYSILIAAVNCFLNLRRYQRGLARIERPFTRPLPTVLLGGKAPERDPPPEILTGSVCVHPE